MEVLEEVRAVLGTVAMLGLLGQGSEASHALGCGQSWGIGFVVILLLPPLFLRDCIRLADRDQRELFMTFSKVFSHSIGPKILDIEA